MGGPELRTAALSFAVEVEELLATAQRTALESTHASVTIEHLLLAFVDADQAKDLLQLDTAALQTLRAQIVSRLMQQTGDPTSYGRVPPQDPALGARLVAADERARALGRPHVDAEAVLAALLAPASPVSEWLGGLGVTAPVSPAPPAMDAPWPPALGGPPPAPPKATEEEDDGDQPTEEATTPTEPAPPFETDRPTDPSGASPAPAPKKTAAPRSKTRDQVEAEAEAERFAEQRPSLEPGPWNPDEFDDDVPTVHASPKGAAEGDEDEIGDEEPTRLADHSEAREGLPGLTRGSPAGSRGAADAPFDVDQEADGAMDPPAPPLPDDLGTDSAFEVPSIPPPVSHGISDGQLIENIPRRMTVDRPETIQVRLAAEDASAVRKGMSGVLNVHNVRVTRAMSARLVAPDGGFSIEPGTPETQWLDDPDGVRDTPAEWMWTITPTRSGKRRLQLVVGARTLREGMVAEAALPLQVIEVQVRANYGRRIFQAAQWLIATLFGAVLGVFSEEILKWVQGVLGTGP